MIIKTWHERWRELIENETSIKDGGFVNQEDAERYANTGWDIDAIEAFISKTVKEENQKIIDIFENEMRADCGACHGQGREHSEPCSILQKIQPTL